MTANKGTVFFDEIGDMSPIAQAKILRAIEAKEVQRLGANRRYQTDIRILAATHHNIDDLASSQSFRRDLYFRLNVIHLHLPPLREIRGDIPLLAQHFLRKYSKEMGRNVESFSQEALKTLTAYNWPGNVRELENEVRRALVLALGKEIKAEDLSANIREECLLVSETEPGRKPTDKQSLKDRVTILEIQMIRDAMAQTANDKRRAAKMLGLSHQGLINKLKRYGLEK